MRLPFFVLPPLFVLGASGLRAPAGVGAPAVRQDEAIADAGGAAHGTGEATQFGERVAELGDRVSEPIGLSARIGYDDLSVAGCGQRALCSLCALELGLERHEEAEATLLRLGQDDRILALTGLEAADQLPDHLELMRCGTLGHGSRHRHRDAGRRQ
jgi:hypothetical protein